MKTFSSVLFSLFLNLICQAQINTYSQWTWVDGSNLMNQPGFYGIQGVPSINNIPPSRDASANWTDNNGYMWLFGGQGWGGSTFYNDLWKYDPTYNTWTWISGNNVANKKGVYGVQGIAALTNTPGSRYSSAYWKDANGNFWLYGGNGYSSLGPGELSDLWKYNATTNMWTWVQGSNLSNKSAVYGTKGIASASNTPGSRYNACTWIDASGNLWLFGGTTLFGYLNDLWKYDPVSNAWAWISGNNSVNVAGTYGVEGIPSGSNTPGSRSGMVSWIDGNGKFWLFGGLSLSGRYNDLWMFDPITNNWTWENGNSVTDQRGVYGTLSVPSSTTIPGARNGMNGWTDSKGNLWLFGGNGYDATNSLGYLNDVWEYDISLQQWVWMKGSNLKNQPSNYGIAGSTSVTDTIGSRSSSSMWIDSGNYWFFGGTTNNSVMNDLWTIPIGFTLSVSLSSFNVDLIDNHARIEWVTLEEQDADHFELLKSEDGISFSAITTIRSEGNSSTARTYNFTDGKLKNGFNYYKLKIINKDGTFSYSDVRKINHQSEHTVIRVKGNPFQSNISLEIDTDLSQNVSIIVTDVTGRIVKRLNPSLYVGVNSIDINASELSKGSYYLGITGQKEFIKLLKL